MASEKWKSSTEERVQLFFEQKIFEVMIFFL